MTTVPVVSVVMSVHNDVHRIERAIRCILGQTFGDFELIAIDDGSTDGSAGILDRLAAEDSRMRVIHQENTGLTRALIRGCEDARGIYIARQDSDDLSLPERFQLQVEMLDRDASLAFVSSWTEVIGPGDEVLLTNTRPVSSEEAMHMLLEQRSGPEHGSVMFRRDAYKCAGGYRELFYYAQDNDLWLRLAAFGRIAYVPRVLYQYRVSVESISGSLHADKVPYANLISDLHEARQRGEDEESIIAKAILSRPGSTRRSQSSADATLYFIGRCLFGRRDPRARGYLRGCLRRNPLNWRAWCLWPLAELAAPFWRISDRLSV